MKRFKIKFRFSVNERWNTNGHYFFGTDADARNEQDELSDAYGCAFLLVEAPPTQDELEAAERHHFCERCGGDNRDPAGTQYACKCPREQQVDRHDGVRWVRETVVFTPGKAAGS